MDTVQSIRQTILEYPELFILMGFMVLIGAVGGARLFAKAGKPWFAALIPIWNVAMVLRIVGRPVSHMAYFLIPFYNVYFFFKLHIELAQSFGKYGVADYVLCCLFNVFYILNLGLAYNEEYYGPVFGLSFKDVQARKPVLV
ncbi:MAG: hypothetical protein JNM00_08805 [Flavobacteriales bacterium]|nr:hypothetical protein [Flavobacteriales bacterium]